MSLKKEPTLKDIAQATKLDLFQTRIDSNLLNRIRKIRNEYNMSWQDLVEYCFTKLEFEYEELKKKNKGA